LLPYRPASLGRTPAGANFFPLPDAPLIVNDKMSLTKGKGLKATFGNLLSFFPGDGMMPGSCRAGYCLTVSG
jgi:hypothetical protein